MCNEDLLRTNGMQNLICLIRCEALSDFYHAGRAFCKVSWLYQTNLERSIDHFTVVCLVALPLNENEAGGDHVLIETSLLFLCKLILISMRIASLT